MTAWVAARSGHEKPLVGPGRVFVASELVLAVRHLVERVDVFGVRLEHASEAGDGLVEASEAAQHEAAAHQGLARSGRPGERLLVRLEGLVEPVEQLQAFRLAQPGRGIVRRKLEGPGVTREGIVEVSDVEGRPRAFRPQGGGFTRRLDGGRAAGRACGRERGFGRGDEFPTAAGGGSGRGGA